MRLRKEKQVTDKTEIQRRDLHGEYECIPERTPVDMLVLEDLVSYRTTHERGPGENEKLMNWAHRSVLLKIKELAEPFGMPILEIPAAYSSKFDARFGVPGFRAFETHNPEDRRLNGFKKALERETNRERMKRLNNLIAQFEAVGQVNITRAVNEKPLYTLIAPQRGGPIFVPIIKSGNPVQADINAAINLGLRAIAAPEAFHIHRRIRTIKKSDSNITQWLPRATKAQQANKREQTAFRKKPIIDLWDTPSVKLNAASKPNFFYDPEGLGGFDKGSIPFDKNDALKVCSGIALWKFLKDNELSRCIEINNMRLKKWNLPMQTSQSTYLNNTHPVSTVANDEDEGKAPSPDN